MLNNCANPHCAKPLHYLREGRIFVFDVQEKNGPVAAGEKRVPRLEHYWLCGDCSQHLQVEHEKGEGIRLVPRRMPNRTLKIATAVAEIADIPPALAS